LKGQCQAGPTKHRKEHKRANLFKNTRISTQENTKKTGEQIHLQYSLI